jgi:hypothetical protein
MFLGGQWAEQKFSSEKMLKREEIIYSDILSETPRVEKASRSGVKTSEMRGCEKWTR